jgi:hypothetical protein
MGDCREEGKARKLITWREKKRGNLAISLDVLFLDK